MRPRRPCRGRPGGLQPGMVRHAFDAGCPICQGSATQSRSIGELVVADCSRCGHGWLTDLRQENEHYETSHYVNWRLENQAATRRRAEQYLADFYELTAGEPRTAVEIGCSTGETIGLLAERGVRGWGADTSEAAIELARTRFPQVGFTVGAMPILDAPVDAALMMHIDRTRAESDRCAPRCLVTGGRRWNYLSPHPQLRGRGCPGVTRSVAGFLSRASSLFQSPLDHNCPVRVGLATRKPPHGGWRLGIAGRCEADRQATTSVTDDGNSSAAWPLPDANLVSCSSLGAAPVESRRAIRPR